ncbi:MAG: KEOPS complex subunit Pcc1 [Methanobacteriota archaeon]
MRCRISITFELDSPEQAKAVAAAVRVDDDCYVKTGVEGKTVRATAEADSPKALMHTLDDYISCASVAIKASSSRPARAPLGP